MAEILSKWAILRSMEGIIGDHDRQEVEAAQTKKPFKNRLLKWSLNQSFNIFQNGAQERA